MIKNTVTAKYRSFLNKYGLQDLPLADLMLLQYNSREYVYRGQHDIAYLMLVTEGNAKVSTITDDGKVLLHSFFQKHDIIGDVELVKDMDSAMLHVQAITDFTCIGIPFRKYSRYLKENIVFMNCVSLALANKLYRTNVNTATIILEPLEIRLCSYIQMTNYNGLFTEQLTEVAQMLGTSYRHLLRTFQKLCQLQILEKTPSGYKIADFKALNEHSKEFL